MTYESYYIIDGNKDEKYTDAGDVARYITENLDEDIYEEVLRETYGNVEVCSYDMDATDVLKQMDPIAFRCGMLDYYDSLSEDIEYDVQRLSYDGEEIDCYGFTVEYRETEEEEDENE